MPLQHAWSRSADSQTGTPVDSVSRDDMMKVLQNIEYIRVRAVYDILSTYSR